MSIYLVTGGAGFIGRHLCRELQAAGHEVRILDSFVEQAHSANAIEELEAEVVVGDIRDATTVSQALKGVDGVFHLAAEVGVGQSMYEVARYSAANSLGTAVLMEQMLGSDIGRIVVASSMSVYGEGLYRDGNGRILETVRRRTAELGAGRWDPFDGHGECLTPVPTPESKRPDLASVYALTKFDQERLTLMLAAAYGFEAVGLRLFNVYGPGQMLSNPYTGVLAIFAGRLLNGQAPLVFEDGRQRRDFVHVSDVARAFRLAMETPGIGGEVFNIASGQDCTIEELARLLARAMDRDDLQPRILNRFRAGDIRHCIADIDHARQRLGFEPRERLDETLLDLVAWVSGQQATDRVDQAQRELEQRGLVV